MSERGRLVLTRSTWRVVLPGSHDFESIVHALVDEGWSVQRRGTTALTATKGRLFSLMPVLAGPNTARRVTVADQGENGLIVEVGIASVLAFGTSLHTEWLGEFARAIPGLAGSLKGAPTSNRMSMWTNIPLMPHMVVIAYFLALGLKLFVIQPIVVPDPGMSPTIPAGGRVLIYKGPGRDRLIRTGSIIVRREGDRYRVGRVVADGPAKVRVENGHTIVDGKLLNEPYATFGNVNWDLQPDADQLVTALDARGGYDSFTLIDESEVAGVVVALYWPTDQMHALLPGQ